MLQYLLTTHDWKLQLITTTVFTYLHGIAPPAQYDLNCIINDTWKSY